LEKILNKIDKYFEHSWRLAVLDMKAGRWLVEPLLSNIFYLKAENANGRHILLQPLPEKEPYYMLSDDITPEALIKDHTTPAGQYKSGRMIIETSPGNYQVWIHSERKLSIPEKKYWLEKLRSDPGAHPKNRLGRCPGFRNRKEKYKTKDGQYPLAKLVWVDWSTKVSIPKIKLKKEKPKKKIYTSIKIKSTISRSDYERGNESRTDFAYALALARRGKSANTIAARILEERNNWDNHTGGKRKTAYLDRTVAKAISIVNYT